MTNGVGDLDVQAEQAWLVLCGGLVEAMAALKPQDFLCIEVETVRSEALDGAIPYVQVMRLEAGVHVEVSSNRYLASRFRLGKDARRRLRALGLAKPEAKGVENYWAVFGLDALDGAAQALVGALREGFGVIHPAFLGTRHPGLAALLHEDVTDVVDLPVQDEPVDLLQPLAGEELATYPEGPEHLQSMVIQALTPVLGRVPEPDDDGDIGVRADTSVVYVRVAEGMPLVTLHAWVVVEVGDQQAAVIESGLLNRDTPGVQFSVDEGAIRARMVLPAVPFVPTVLRAMLQRMLHVVSRADKDLARRVGGLVFLDDSGTDSDAEDPQSSEGAGSQGSVSNGEGHRGNRPDAAEGKGDGSGGAEQGDSWTGDRIRGVLDQMHPALARLVLADASDPGSVQPGAAARMCDGDARVMRKVLRSSVRAESTLRNCRREAAAAQDEEAADFFRYFRKRVRGVRAVVEEALRRGERAGRQRRPDDASAGRRSRPGGGESTAERTHERSGRGRG